MNQSVESSIESIIKNFIDYSPENTLRNQGNDKAFDTPLVGFSRGDDPLYEAYKEHVGISHLTPLEIFSKSFPLLEVLAEDLTIISWVLPQTEATKSDNRKETILSVRKMGKGANLR